MSDVNFLEEMGESTHEATRELKLASRSPAMMRAEMTHQRVTKMPSRLKGYSRSQNRMKSDDRIVKTHRATAESISLILL
jgi:hypothetical protein